MNELEKCMAGEWYDCHNEIFLEYKNTARELLAKYNNLSYNQKEEKTVILKQLFGSIGDNVSVGQPFICDYGRNIYLGTNVSVNMNCTFVDCNKIEIGNNVLIASNVQIYTATHPVELADRLTPNWDPKSGEYFCRTYALPVKIGDSCWIGGGAIILPGVTIGEGAVIGAGSVVTKDIPANCVAVGNPCRVIRKINLKTMYFDRSENKDAISVFIKDTEIIPAGTTIYSMSVKDKNEEYDRFAKEYDVHFIFDDAVPSVDFYTVPQFDVMAVDRDGGLIGTLGGVSDLESDQPIGYIDKNKKCYLIAGNLKEFMKIVSDWRSHITVYEDMLFFDDLADAKSKLEFIELPEIG